MTSHTIARLEQTRILLTDIHGTMENFLNETTVTGLVESLPDADRNYYAGILSSLRRLAVFSEEGIEICNRIKKQNDFEVKAEKALQWVFLRCVEEFFSPKGDFWYENSRAAYTGNLSIRFHFFVPDKIKDLFSTLEKPFGELREELELYQAS
ncbi:DUF3907 family protein [Pseudalkalibacillus caeni]|uniref:DUF3907 family protein n=1 Tax=Exobacillus caeni TaxID=2574798 RepID=UPI001484CFAB|nr:DUF3907 family protein [Pseudalkalibacillus caeni]